MEKIYSVVQNYGTQSRLKTGLNRPLMQETLVKLDECEKRVSELLNDFATDESKVITLSKGHVKRAMVHCARNF